MALIFLDANNPLTISDNNAKAFGNAGAEIVKITKGNTGIVLDSNIERIELTGVIADYKFKQLGNKLAIYDANDALVVKTGLQDDTNGMQLSFENGTTTAKLVPNATGFVMTVDNQTLSNTSTQIHTIPALQPVLEQSSVVTGNKIFLESNDAVLHVNNSGHVYGATGTQAVVIGANVKNVLADANVERVQLDGSYKNYLFKQVGFDLEISNQANEIVAKIGVQYDTNGTRFTFAEGTVNVLIRSSASALNLTIGDVVVTATGQIAQKITIPETSFDTSLRSENSTLQHITVSSTGSTDASTGNFQFDFSAGNAVIPTALTLTGGAGDDTLTGGTGDDVLTGATGADTFIVTAGKDTITDFVLGSDALTVTKGTGTANVNVKFADGTVATYNVTTDATIPATVKTKADLDKIAGVAVGSLVLVGTENGVSNYQYQISNFSKGDVLNFPDGANVTLKNTNPTDGKIEIDWIQNQQTVAVHLTGLSTEQDLAVLSVGEFNQLFGDNSIQ